MTTTMKISKETKERLKKLDLSEKGKSFDMLVNDLITFYQKSNKKYVKDYKKWEQSFKAHQKEAKDYEKRLKEYDKSIINYQKDQIIWNKLLKWAKSKGFKS